MSRRRISEASFPSISPEWIPATMRTIGLSSACAAAGAKARSFETTTYGIGRPSPDVPKNPSRSAGDFASSRRRKAIVSS